MTFHSSKGLEYRVVGIPGLGYLPHERFAEADEVRLAYVAMTRATERLVLSNLSRGSAAAHSAGT